MEWWSCSRWSLHLPWIHGDWVPRQNGNILVAFNLEANLDLWGRNTECQLIIYLIYLGCGLAKNIMANRFNQTMEKSHVQSGSMINFPLRLPNSCHRVTVQGTELAMRDLALTQSCRQFGSKGSLGNVCMARWEVQCAGRCDRAVRWRPRFKMVQPLPTGPTRSTTTYLHELAPPKWFLMFLSVGKSHQITRFSMSFPHLR